MFTVTWSNQAQDQLAGMWTSVKSANRRELTDIVALLDKHLSANAPRIGESREDESLRCVSEGPLGIEFQVSEEDRLVIVLRAWMIPRRRK